jgi:hypothetical protein
MGGEIPPVEIGHLPDLLELAESVQASGESRLLKCGDREVALITPVERKAGSARRPRRRDRRTNENDPLWNIIGVADAAGSPNDPTDVAANKHEYLADAYDIKQS